MTNRVFVDANILYSRTIRDWLFLLRSETPVMFQLHSTEDVLTEVAYNYRRKNKRIEGAQVLRLNKLLRDNLDEILDNFRSNEDFSGNDEDDYHVHAGALYGQADYLLTNNVPSDLTTDRQPYEIVTADEFFMLVGSAARSCVVAVTEKQLDYWGSRGCHMQLDEALRKAGCPKFAELVRHDLQQLALRKD